MDFDIENRPISYLGSDWTTADITAIAWSFCDEKEVHVRIQTKRAGSQRSMLRAFLAALKTADGVTGHNIRRHDLPHINGALLELGIPRLGRVVTSDTYGDIRKMTGISKSQENLCAMLGVEAPKVKMNTATWREANRLTPAGLEATQHRVVGDVVQHKMLRQKLLDLDLLGPPKVWRG
jgi:hypothetical protein